MTRIISAVFVVVGLVAGTFTERAPDTPDVTRGGYSVIAADFHVHSFLGDGMLSPFALVTRARHQGLDAFAISDHNRLFMAKAGRWYSRLVGGPTVVLGEEITAPGFHVIALGIHRHVTWRQSAAEVVADIHRQGGVAIAAHPTRRFWPQFDGNVVRQLDGAEVMHTHAYASNAKWQEMSSFYRQAEHSGHHLTAIGSSDYHWFNSLGLCRTYVFVRNNDEAEILDALRAGRTVVYDREGNAFGSPELIRLLEDQPITRDSGDYNYSGSGVVDVITRTLGWLDRIGTIWRESESRFSMTQCVHIRRWSGWVQPVSSTFTGYKLGVPVPESPSRWHAHTLCGVWRALSSADTSDTPKSPRY